MERIQRIIVPLLIFAATLLLGLAGSAPIAQAQEPITASSEAILQPEMPRRLLFTLEAQSSAGNLTSARLYFQPTGSSVRQSEAVEFEPAATVSLEYEWHMQLNHVPPGVEVEYFWELTDSAGNTIETPRQTVLALDPRFEWQTVEDEQLAVYWYQGGSEWGQEMFQTGKKAIAKLEESLGATLDRRIRLVAYGSQDDFKGAFPPQQEWVGGQAFFHMGVTVQVVPDGSQEWMETVLYHELSHLVLHQALDGAITRIPSWLHEGVATYNEPHARNNEEIVQEAARSGEILPFSYLQGNFGADHNVTNLAYAQSGQLVTYLIEDCGREGFRQFITNMNEERMDLDRALEEACGYNSQSLYDNWRQTLPNPPSSTDDTGSEDGVTSEEVAPDEGVETEEAPANTEEPLPRILLLFLVGGICFVGIIAVAMIAIVLHLVRGAGRPASRG